MIQRIQTIFLFIVAFTMLAMSTILPLWAVQTPDGSKMAKLWAWQMILKEGSTETTMANPIVIMILGILAGLVALFSIFKFKNRLTQMKLGMLNSLLIGGALVAEVFYVNMGMKEFGEIQLTGGYMIGFWMPIGAVLANFLANRFIRRDEKLVRDSDRIR